jgi:hypothetical protein
VVKVQHQMMCRRVASLSFADGKGLLDASPTRDPPAVSDLLPVLWLCGPSGVGKSTVGWRLSAERDVRVPTDGRGVDDSAAEILTRSGW